MNQMHEIGKDLSFVREVVTRRERGAGGLPMLSYLWAGYVFVGYALLDVNVSAAGAFFAVGGMVGGLLSWLIAARHARRFGESDHAATRRAAAHFGGGILLAWIFCLGLAAMIVPLRGPQGSQVFVVMIGLVYFLWGVHQDRYFLWLGAILMAGGVLVGLFPHYGWTGLGAIIALGLIVPTFSHRDRQAPMPDPA